MKLSEAILLGSVGTGQARHVLLDHAGNTCAMGAALAAIGVEMMPTDKNRMTEESVLAGAACFGEAKRVWPILNKKVKHPHTGTESDLDCAIMTLNDIYGWSRPCIAEWVKSIELQEEAKEDTCQNLKKIPATMPS